MLCAVSPSFLCWGKNISNNNGRYFAILTLFMSVWNEKLAILLLYFIAAAFCELSCGDGAGWWHWSCTDRRTLSRWEATRQQHIPVSSRYTYTNVEFPFNQFNPSHTGGGGGIRHNSYVPSLQNKPLHPASLWKIMYHIPISAVYITLKHLPASTLEKKKTI